MICPGTTEGLGSGSGVPRSATSLVTHRSKQHASHHDTGRLETVAHPDGTQHHYETHAERSGGSALPWDGMEDALGQGNQ